MFEATLLNKGTLTDRESEVLCKVCEGLPNKTIAARLNMSIKTLNAHEQMVYEKLGIRKQSVNLRVTAILTALSNGMVSITKAGQHG